MIRDGTVFARHHNGTAQAALVGGRAVLDQRNPKQQTHLMLTPVAMVVSALGIFVTAFLLGLWCGWMWR
jgi:hypothetical protein